jgi:hypothetical protein
LIGSMKITCALSDGGGDSDWLEDSTNCGLGGFASAAGKTQQSAIMSTMFRSTEDPHGCDEISSVVPAEPPRSEYSEPQAASA